MNSVSSDPMISLTSVVVAAQDQISSDLGHEVVILSLISDAYFGLDAVGARIWDLIQEPRSVSDVRDAILAEYEVAPGQCERDLLALLHQLATRQLVEIKS